jgi:hypothetical protein
MRYRTIKKHFQMGATMKFLVLATAVAISAFAISGTTVQAQQARQDFMLVNKTGYDIKEVYVSPSKADDWEEDVLGDDELEEGTEQPIKFSRKEKTCKWDMKVVYSDDDSSVVWHDLDLCKISKITIKYNRKTDKSSATFD